MRRIGVRDLVIGGALAGIAGVALYMAFPIASTSSGILKALAVTLMAGLYGLWKLLKGIICLVRPGAERRSIPDVEQSGLIE